MCACAVWTAGEFALRWRTTGRELRQRDADRVFEPFFRTDLARVRDTGGTGLGLSIVASIAQAHGGFAGVAANDGGGALFWVEFPTGVDAPMAVKPLRRTGVASNGGQRR